MVTTGSLYHNVAGWATKHFSTVFCIMLVIGLVFQNLAARVQPVIAWLLIAVIYMGFLRVDPKGLIAEAKNWRRTIGMVVLLQLIIPAVGFFSLRTLCRVLDWSDVWAQGTLLILLAPAGAIVPTLCLLMHGRFERGILLLVASSLTVPVTMPLMLWALLGGAGEMSPIAVGQFLAFVMITPAIAALATRRFTPKVIDRIHPHVPILSVLGLCGVIIGAVSGLRPILMESPSMAAKGCLITTLGYLIAFLIGWFCGRGSPKDRMTLAIAATWTNIALAIVTADRLFAESAKLIVLATTLGEIPWNILFPPGQWFANRFAKTPPPESTK